MDIGNKIQTIRAENGMTQAEFAEKFNVTRQSVSNWENNKNYPDMDTLCKISDEYDVSFDVLLKEDREYVSRIDKTANQALKATRGLKMLIPFAILLLIICIGIMIHQNSADPSDSVIMPGETGKDYKYSVNENGQTYGLDWAADDYEEHAPDLIAAEGINGRRGYVKRIDLEEAEGDNLVNSPKEAVEYMKRQEQRKGKNYFIVVPVFEKDGTTEVDQFWVYNGAE